MAWLITLILTFPNTASATPEPSYASDKQRVCSDCKILVPPAMVPRRGVVISDGSFTSALGYWETIDFDTRTMTRFVTRFDRNTHELTVTQSRCVVLSEEDVADVITLTNAVWRNPQKLTGTVATDVVWGIDLFDGDTTRKENGVGVLQHGEGADLRNGAARIWQRLAH